MNVPELLRSIRGRATQVAEAVEAIETNPSRVTLADKEQLARVLDYLGRARAELGFAVEFATGRPYAAVA